MKNNENQTKTSKNLAELEMSRIRHEQKVGRNNTTCQQMAKAIKRSNKQNQAKTHEQQTARKPSKNIAKTPRY